MRIGDDRAVLALADGLGGRRSGAEAAELALRVLTECIAAAVAAAGADDAPLLRTAILDGFERANGAVAGLGTGAATTLAAVEIDGAVIRPYHAGDSMILAVGQRGRMHLKTLPHSPVGYGEAAGLLDADEAIHHAERHLVSNVVGSAEMRIDVGPPLTLHPRDTLVVASDGLFDNLHVEEIVEHVRKGDLVAASEGLVSHARRRHGPARAGRALQARRPDRDRLPPRPGRAR